VGVAAGIDPDVRDALHGRLLTAVVGGSDVPQQG
jgi:hypothetical protein